MILQIECRSTFAGELVEALPCCLLGVGRVDELELAGELVTVVLLA